MEQKHKLGKKRIAGIVAKVSLSGLMVYLSLTLAGTAAYTFVERYTPPEWMVATFLVVLWVLFSSAFLLAIWRSYEA